jgi:ribosomal protein L37AE/L43A
MNPTGREAREQPPPDPVCPGCGSRLRYRGRRKSVVVWECEDPGCPTMLVEMLDPGAPARRKGGAP